MENKIELTVEEKRELAMEVWKNYLLSVQYGDDQALAAEKDQLIRQAVERSTRQLSGVPNRVNLGL